MGVRVEGPNTSTRRMPFVEIPDMTSFAGTFKGDPCVGFRSIWSLHIYFANGSEPATWTWHGAATGDESFRGPPNLYIENYREAALVIRAES